MVEHEERQLICEGRCNPYLREYDEARARVHRSEGFETRDSKAHRLTVASMCRDLKHTTHISETNDIWQPPWGWVRRWRCLTCGYPRVA